LKKPIVALIYDFDKTLCTKDMQEYGFIPSIGMNSSEFWKEVRDLTDRENMDGILAYIFKMVEKARGKKVSISYEIFKKLGEGIKYFDGVTTWFERINEYGKNIGVRIEHYIVSSGIKEIEIARYFKKIYACEFMYDYNGSIQWPKFAINYTAKTQFLFRINKQLILKVQINLIDSLLKMKEEFLFKI
jgi:putative phosphatase